jgi:hypothetical protein
MGNHPVLYVARYNSVLARRAAWCWFMLRMRCDFVAWQLPIVVALTLYYTVHSRRVAESAT